MFKYYLDEHRLQRVNVNKVMLVANVGGDTKT
jgi:hypothetical protein